MGDLAYSRVFPGTMTTAMRRLRTQLENRGYAIVSALKVNRFLERSGRSPVDPMVILEVSSPDYLERALSISRQSALLLPCRFVISREDSETLIALQRPTIAAHALLPIPALVLLNALAERSLEEAIDATVGPQLSQTRVPVYVTIDQTVRRLPPPAPRTAQRRIGGPHRGNHRRRLRPEVAHPPVRPARNGRRPSRTPAIGNRGGRIRATGRTRARPRS